MSYTYGTSNIKKNNYDVYVRAHSTAEAIDKDAKLKGILQDVTAFGTDIDTDGNTGSALTTTDRIYTIIGTDDTAGVFDLDDWGGAPAADQFMVIVADEAGKDSGEALTNNITITDYAETDTILNADGESAIFYDDGSGFDFYGWANSDGIQSTEYTKIGGCEEKPSIKTSQGQAIMISNGDELTVSENLEITFNDLQVTADNYEFLRSLSNVDICLYNKNTPSAIFVYDVEAQAFLEAIGNDLNKTVFNVKLETDDVDNHLTIYAATV